MSTDSVRESLGHQLRHDDQYKGFAALHTEIRLMIWRLAYALESPRLVEIQTLEHHHYNYTHRWCPRYSPSPRPTIVNVCQEARHEAWNEARKAGHLLFATNPDASDIYFNPEIDTLYIPNGNNDWIRTGPEGVLTQLRKDNEIELPHCLAVGLDAESCGLTINTLRRNVEVLRGLKVVNFVVEESSDKMLRLIRRLNRSMRIRQRRNPDEVGAYPDKCRLATRHGHSLQLIPRQDNMYDFVAPVSPLLSRGTVWSPTL